MQNRQGEVKNSIGNGEVKELTCPIHGNELRRGRMRKGGGTQWREKKGRKKGTTVIT